MGIKNRRGDANDGTVGSDDYFVFELKLHWGYIYFAGVKRDTPGEVKAIAFVFQLALIRDADMPIEIVYSQDLLAIFIYQAQLGISRMRQAEQDEIPVQVFHAGPGNFLCRRQFRNGCKVKHILDAGVQRAFDCPSPGHHVKRTIRFENGFLIIDCLIEKVSCCQNNQ